MPIPSTIDLDRYAFLLDVDGTLVDFAATPREVWVSPELRETISTLLERTDGALALVSGRSLSDLDLLFTPLQLAAVGGHGAEFRPAFSRPPIAGGTVNLDSDLKRRFAAIKDLGRGILIEDKGYSIALHYRLAPDLEKDVRHAVATIEKSLPKDTIEFLDGKFVIEAKPMGFSKATAVRELMKHPPFSKRKPIFIGDDKTDETVFPIIPEFDGYAFAVGRDIPGTHGWFESPHEVRKWLKRVSVQSAVSGP